MHQHAGVRLATHVYPRDRGIQTGVTCTSPSSFLVEADTITTYSFIAPFSLASNLLDV
jgi:hypothetical protein